MRAVLCIGLHNGRQVMPLAPKLVKETGEIVHATGLSGPPTLGQRVTYLASVLGRAGLYDCEVGDDGTIIPGTSPLAPEAVPEFMQRVLTVREWQAPATRAPAARRAR